AIAVSISCDGMTPASESFEALTRIINRIDSLPFRRRMGVAASPPVPPRRPAGGGIDAPHGFFYARRLA
ncbi:MAG TPA: hypothetical protein VKE26_25190, partial [Xanthobacteraceae bacterium]|nr:hypothetical protein [Xanthobacteraceae bacterium]